MNKNDNKYKGKNIVSFTLKIIISLVFITSGILKIVYYDQVVINIISYNVLDQSYVGSIILLLSTLEITFGMMLLFNIYLEFAIKILLLLSLIFIIFNIYSIILDKAWTCSCFGEFFETEISYFTLIRDCLIFLILLVVRQNPTKYMSYEDLTANTKLIINILVLASGIVIYILINIHNNKKYISENVMLEEVIINDNGKVINLLKRDKPYLLLILFSTDDCPSCLDEGFMWERISSGYSDSISVHGVGYSSNKFLIDSFLKHKGITFPVFSDSDNSLLDRFLIHTPLKVLINKNNRILSIERSLGSQIYQRNYRSRIDSIIFKKY